MEKGSGVLLHISSLPSRFGIGTFGKEARKFVRFLHSAHQKYWQILPLNPTSYGDSPYQSFSAFALNPYFIDLEYLLKRGYLTKEDLKTLKITRKNRFVDYGYIYETRFPLLRKAAEKAYLVEEEKINNFAKREKSWLDDYSLFMTIKNEQGGASFLEWPHELRMHKKAALEEFRNTHLEEIKFWKYVQYEAFRQYKALKRYANRKGVKIIGDMPIYVAADSADVWGNARIYMLNQMHRPKKVAGVPPDYFSEDGQLWGNPLYDWDKMEKNKYKWWKKRFKKMSSLYDYVRIDHFRAFDTYYAIPAGATTARVGEWEKGPGIKFFNEVLPAAPKLKVIAEDLGDLADSVYELMEQTGFPGLKVYQFAFADYKECLDAPEDEEVFRNVDRSSLNQKQYKELKLVNPFLPHHYIDNCVAYIGTHDNDVLKSYLENHPEEIPCMMDYLGLYEARHVYDTLIGSLMRSAAGIVIFTMQDLLRLGGETRMNTPGKASGNWAFRLLKDEASDDVANWLGIMTLEASR